MHKFIYCETKLPMILGRPRQSTLNVSEDAPVRLLPAGAQAWQPFWLLVTKNSCIIRVIGKHHHYKERKRL